MPSDTRTLFQKALALHQGGDAVGAQALYRKVLKHDPRHFDSLHLLGLTYVQQGELARGAEQISAALAVRPGFAEAHYNLGHALLSLGRPADALASFERAIALNGRDPLSHFERGNALKELGRSAEAMQSFEAALGLVPRFADAHNNIGVVLKDEGRFEEALAHYDKAISLRPSYAEAHSNRGNVLKELERFEEALASYDRAIALRPDYAEAYSNRGNALARLGSPERALESHDRAISLRPDYAEGHNNRGNALKDLGRLDQALASFDTALRLRPDYAEALSNRGGALAELGRLDEALADHDRAVSLKPKSAEAWCSRGNALVDLDRPMDALASYEEAMRLKPAFAMARYNASLVALRKRDFATGFDFYRARFAAEKPGARGPETVLPPWDGAACDGEVLLWAEQGLGDEVFFAAMLSLVDPAQKIALSADKRLHPALARSFPHVRLIGREVTEQRVEGPFVAQAAVGDLGFLLKVDAARIAQRRYPYLIADQARRAALRVANSPAGGELVCGVAWRSGNMKLGHHRSVALADFAPLLQLPGLRLVNLQYGQVEEEIAGVAARLGSTVNIAGDVDVFNDIEGLLALIDACDVVFTIDNVTAHLAGALGKLAVVLVPAGQGRHWYWGGESRSLWYPSLTLAYQQVIGSWREPVTEASRFVAGMLGRANG